MLQITVDLKTHDALEGGKRDFNCDSRGTGSGEPKSRGVLASAE
jgi:hypothetical protein